MATDIFDHSQTGQDRGSLATEFAVPPESAGQEDSGGLPIPPTQTGTLLLPLCLPSIALGLLAVLASSWLFRVPSAALLTYAGCLTGLLATIALFRRQEAAAVAVLNRPDLRSSDLAATGVFRSLLGELIHQVEHQETRTRNVTDQRARLDVRAHVLKNQVRRLIHVLDHVEQPVFVVDASNTLIYRNAPGTALLNSVTGDATLPAAVAWDYLLEAKGLVESVSSRAAAAAKRTAELQLKCSGEMITFRADAANLFDEKGTHQGVSDRKSVV